MVTDAAGQQVGRQTQTARSRLAVLWEPAGYQDGMSLYEYVRSGPVGAVDPEGLQTSGPASRPTTQPARPPLPNEQSYAWHEEGDPQILCGMEILEDKSGREAVRVTARATKAYARIMDRSYGGFRKVMSGAWTMDRDSAQVVVGWTDEKEVTHSATNVTIVPATDPPSGKLPVAKWEDDLGGVELPSAPPVEGYRAPERYSHGRDQVFTVIPLGLKGEAKTVRVGFIYTDTEEGQDEDVPVIIAAWTATRTVTNQWKITPNAGHANDPKVIDKYIREITGGKCTLSRRDTGGSDTGYDILPVQPVSNGKAQR